MPPADGRWGMALPVDEMVLGGLVSMENQEIPIVT
jgi:hypothetical protein